YKKPVKKLWSVFSKNASKRDYGNLSIEIDEIPHAMFTRDHLDLIYHLQINRAALKDNGKLIEINLLDQEILKIQILNGIQDGKILRIKGKGFKDIQTSTYGSLLIIVNVINDH
ncbi:MAG: DnaJ C-terminal domain-containing protein, partial [Bacteroidota bacterium]